MDLDDVIIDGINMPLLNSDFILNSTWNITPNLELNNKDFYKPIHITAIDPLPSSYKKTEHATIKSENTKRISGGSIKYKSPNTKGNIKFVI